MSNFVEADLVEAGLASMSNHASLYVRKRILKGSVSVSHRQNGFLHSALRTKPKLPVRQEVMLQDMLQQCALHSRGSRFHIFFLLLSCPPCVTRSLVDTVYFHVTKSRACGRIYIIQRSHTSPSISTNTSNCMLYLCTFCPPALCGREL